MSKTFLRYTLMSSLLMICLNANAQIEISISKISINGVGKRIGKIKAIDTPNGLLLTPNLYDLPPGDHGFHIHQNPSCEPLEKDGAIIPGLSAGGHFDPQNSGTHRGYMGNGHKGDLPVITVNADGRSERSVIAPHLTEADIYERSIVIHAGGDNYSDAPLLLGGGGERIACGVIRNPKNGGKDEEHDEGDFGNPFTFFHNLLNGLDGD